jgi:hypothetical protein
MYICFLHGPRDEKERCQNGLTSGAETGSREALFGQLYLVCSIALTDLVGRVL